MDLEPCFGQPDADDFSNPKNIVRDVRALQNTVGRSQTESRRFDVQATLLLFDETSESVRLQHNRTRLFGKFSGEIPRDALEFKSLVRLRGRTVPGKYWVLIDSIERVGEGKLPETIRIHDHTEVFEPRLHTEYCQLRGRVLEIHSEHSRHHFLIRTKGGQRHWVLNAPMPEEQKLRLLGSEVSADGVALRQSDPELPGFMLMGMHPSQIRPKSKPIEAKTQKLDGVVVGLGRRGFVGISDGKSLHWLYSGIPRQLAVGDSVSAIYIPNDDDIEGFTGRLRYLRQTGRVSLPSPQLVKAATLVQKPYPPYPVSIECTIRSVNVHAKEVDVRMKDGETIFTAQLASRQTANLDDHQAEVKQAFRPGTVVRITGVNRLLKNSSAGGSQFKFIVNDPRDVAVIARPYNVYSTQLGVAALIALSLLAGFTIWNLMLRVKVQDRTRDVVSLAARLQASCDAICEGILFFDRDGVLVQATGIANKLVSTNTDDRANPQPPPNYDQIAVAKQLAPKMADAERFHAFWRASFSSKNATVCQDFEFADGSGVFSFFSNAVADKDGVFDGRIFTVEDITLRKKMEHNAMQQQKMHAFGQLAGGVAHDFNNLLLAISANLSLSELQASDPEKVREHIAIASEATNRATVLTRQLLGFSRRSTLSFQVAHVNDVVSEVSKLLRHMLGESINLTQAMAIDLWPVSMDCEQIERVLLNLAINARDSTKDQAGQITLRTQNYHHRHIGDCVMIQVQDDGCGMSPEVSERVFEPFFTTKAVGEGTGLGLAMAFGIIRQHGGVIDCKSELGLGTTFSVCLPRSNQEFDDLHAQVSTSRLTVDQSTDDGTRRRGRVLLVDDEKMVRDAAAAMLRVLGHDSACASDGQQAIDHLDKDAAFDLVLLDLTMPVLTGSETLIQIKQRHPDLRVVICSGYSADAQELLENDAFSPDDFLPKPFRLDDMRRLLDASIRDAEDHASNQHC